MEMLCYGKLHLNGYIIILIEYIRCIESSIYVIRFNIQNVNVRSRGKANKIYFCRIDSFIWPLYGN